MADIKWIKITTDMFDNRKIKHIRRLPDGNNMVLIWVMLLTMAGKCNDNGKIFLTETISYTPKMLADELDFEENTVRLALETLQRLEMISISEDFLQITSWTEHQNIEGLDKIREQNRIRKQRQRDKKNLMIEKSGSRDMSRDVTQQNKNKNKNKESNNIYKVEQDSIPYDEIISFLNQKAGTKYKTGTKKTKACIHARAQEGFSVDDFKTVIEKKCKEWIGTEFEQYLRPETLFGLKFEGYLNAKTRTKDQNKMSNAITIEDQNNLDDIF